MRRTKIVATIGPASASELVLRELIRNGMDIARLNFSHGTHESHQLVLERIRRISAEEGRHVAVLQDLGGPKIRTGTMPPHAVIDLLPGSEVALVSGLDRTEPGVIGISYPRLEEEVSAGQKIFINDGLIELRIARISGSSIFCNVIRGGPLTSRKGVNVPGAALISAPAVTMKDWQDLEWGLQNGADAIALSFVRQAAEIAQVQQRIAESGKTAPVFAKIEKPQALDNIAAIVKQADGIMIARGDLGVEVEPERIPLIQKELISLCNEHERPVITATQMLESMTHATRPTRAEVSDVANAIFDGTDAVMLSGETASGEFPIEALQMMARIAEQSDDYIAQHPMCCSSERLPPPDNVSEAVGRAGEYLARKLNIRAVFVAEIDGTRTSGISKSRPVSAIYALADDPAVQRRLNFLWGVTPMPLPPVSRGSALLRDIESLALKHALANHGDWILLLASTPHALPGPLNTLRLQQIS